MSSFQRACDGAMIGTEAIAEFLINNEETKVVSTVLCFKNYLLSVELQGGVQTCCDLNLNLQKMLFT